MGWVGLWVVVAAIGAAGLVASINNVRWGRRFEREVAALPPGPRAGGTRVDRERLAELPPPVRRYLARALGARTSAIRTVHILHGGTFRPSLQGAWLPIRGEQHFATDPPSFVWWGRVRVAPGVWIDALDRSVGGVGRMSVAAESTITLADSHGPELDQGALVRLLGEMAWFPTALADGRYVRWSPLDDRRARATLTVNGRTATADFTFGDDDLPSSVTSDRYRDEGGGRAVLTPFVGRSLAFRDVGGILVPHSMVAAWQIDGQLHEYVRFEVERIAFDEPVARR